MNTFKNSSVVDSTISLVTISQSFTGLAFMSLSSVSWKSIYFFLITPQWEARTAALHGYVCSYHGRVLYLTYPSNSTRFLKQTLHLQTSLCFVLVSRTLLVPGWLLHCCMTPSSCPLRRLDCAPGFLYFASYTMGGTVWSAGHWHEPFSAFFFFYLKVRRASCIIYQHFLGGHTFFSLLSGLTQLPSVLLSTRGPPVLDNTLHCYMKKNELWWESEILSPSIVCPVSCVLLIAASLYIHAYKLPLLSFIPEKKTSWK